jgi:uracil-DNA glycosylase
MAPELDRSAADFFPKRVTLRTLGAAVQECRGCDLYRDATQAVFGEGPPDAQVMLVGEQPGDREDVMGRRSSDQQERCWTERSRRRRSTGTRST